MNHSHHKILDVEDKEFNHKSNTKSKNKNETYDLLNSKRLKEIQNTNKSFARNTSIDILSSNSINNITESSIKNTETRINRLHNAFNNARISGVKSLNTLKGHSKMTSNKVNPFKNEATINYELILKIVSGGISLASLALILYKYNNEIIDLSLNVKNSIIENQNDFLAGILFITTAVFSFIIYKYLKQRQEYISLCKELANISNNDIIKELSDSYSNTQSFIEEDIIISKYSKMFKMTETSYMNDVYKPYLKNILENNPSMNRRDLVENGEIKIFWVYMIDDIEVESEE